MNPDTSQEQNRLLFMVKALEKPLFCQKLDEFIEQLRNQGILNDLICKDKINELNEKMKAAIPKFVIHITSENYVRYFRLALAPIILNDVYNVKADSATDEDIINATSEFCCKLDWKRIFKQLFEAVRYIEDSFYMSYLLSDEVLEQIFPDDQAALIILISEVFCDNDVAEFPYMDLKFLVENYYPQIEGEDPFDQTVKDAGIAFYADYNGMSVDEVKFCGFNQILEKNYKITLVNMIIWEMDSESDSWILDENSIRDYFNDMKKNRPLYLIFCYFCFLKNNGSEALIERY